MKAWTPVLMFFICLNIVMAFDTTSLENYYNFNGNSEDLQGTLDGTDTNIQYGIGNDFMGQSAYCNGTAYINFEQIDDNIANAQAFSLVIWIRHNESVDVDAELMGFGTATPRLDWRIATASVPFLSFTRFNDGFDKDTQGGAENTAKNDWIMLSITYNKTNTEMKTYLNATEVDDDPHDLGDWRTSLAWWVCGRNGASANKFNGQIDEFSVWSRTLLPTEITELYNNGIGLSILNNFSVTAKNIVNGSDLSTFTADVNGTIYNTTNFQINTSIPHNVTGKINITFQAPNYLNKTYYNITPLGNFSANLSPATHLNITYKDEKTLNTVTDNVTLNAFNSDLNLSFSNHTVSGNAFIMVITPANYTLKYSALPTYIKKFYQLEVLGTFNYSLTLYLSNNSLVSDVTATVIDQNLEVVEGLDIHVLRFDSETNSFFTTEIIKTNFEGQALLHIILNDEFYKFKIFQNGDLLFETEPTVIFTIDITLQVNTEGTFAENYQTFRNIIFDHNFTNSSQLVYFDWNDPNSRVSRACLEVYQITGIARSLVNSSCVSATSGTIFLGGINESLFFYESFAYVDLPGENNIVLSNFVFGGFTKLPEIEQGIFYFIILQLVILFSFIGGISIGLAVFPLPMIAGYYLNWLVWPLEVIAGITFMCWVVAAIIAIKKNG